MKRVSAYIAQVAASIAARSAALGERVVLDESILDRSDSIALNSPGQVSSNGSCRLLRAQDAWIAVNLPRGDDREAVPALLEAEA